MNRFGRLSGKLYRLTFLLSLCIFGCNRPDVQYLTGEEIFEDFGRPADRYRPGVRFAVQGNFDGANEVHLAGLESEVRELYATGISTIEIQAGMGDPADIAYKNVLKVFYSVGNELGMSMDLRVGGAGGIQGGTPQALFSSAPLTVEGGYTLTGGTELTGIASLDDITFDEKLVAVLAVKYTTGPDDSKVQTDVMKLNVDDFTYTSSEIEDGEAETVGESVPGNRSPLPREGGDEQSEGGFSGGQFPGGGMPGGGFPGGGPGGPGFPGGGFPGGGPGGPGPGFPGRGTPVIPGHDVTVAYTGNDLVIGEPGETWDIISYYKSRDTDGAGMDNTDFYSRESSEIIIENTEALFDDTLKEMIRENGGIGGLFAVDGGDRNQQLSSDTWSDELQAKIQELYGYDFTDYLAVQYSGYRLPADDAYDRLNNDWKEAFCYLFADYLTNIEKWASENYNSGFRCQIGFDTELDVGIVSQYVSQSDVESFWPSGGASIKDYNLEAGYLAVTSVSNIIRRTITGGNEVGAIPRVHSASWPHFLLVNINKALYSGVNMMLYHCIDTQFGNAWGTGYDVSNYMSWGNVNPQFVTSPEFNAYVARAQYLLQNGAAERDFMVYDHVYTDSYRTSYLMDNSVKEAGYNYDIVSPALLATGHLQEVENGIVDPGGGRYRALVITRLLEGSEGRYMPVSAAETALKYARSGVPVIIVGRENYPVKAMSFSSIDQDDRLSDIFTEINALGMLTVIEHDTGLAEALRNAGVEPNMKKDASSRIVSYKRLTDDGNTAFYFLYNYAISGKSGRVSQKISLKGGGRPYLMDLWSGEVKEIANYNVSDEGYITVDIALDPHETCLIAIRHEGQDKVHATETGSGLTFGYDSEGNLVLKAAENGTYTINLSNGTSRTVTVDHAAGPLTLNEWTLQVESWTPTYGYGSAPSDPAYSMGDITTKTLLDPVKLEALVPWTSIDGIGRGISGVGIYTTDFEFDGDCDGARLDLGSVYETALVFINGNQVYPDFTSCKADLSEYLVRGENTLEVRTPSDLQNVLLANGGQYTRNDTIRDYGLLGPVVVTPFVSVALNE